MFVRSTAQRALIFALVLVFMVCCVPTSFLLTARAETAPDGYMYYNGVLLYKVPEWDAYPYRMIGFNTYHNCYYVMVCSVPFNVTVSEATNPSGMQTVFVPVITDGANLRRLTGTTWSAVQMFEPFSRASFYGSSNIVWANFDLYDYDGNLMIGGTSPSMVNGAVSISLSRTVSTMERGGDYPIVIDVTGNGDFDPACSCVVSGNTSDATYVYLDDSLNYDSPNTYHLVIGADEIADTLTITATSIVNPSVSATHTVTLVDPVVPGITAIDLSRTQDWGKPGSGIYIYVDTVGVGTYNAACTCVVSGNTSADTRVVDLGGDAYLNRFYLIIGDNEMSPLVDITVTSIANPSVSACWTIELSEPGVPDPTEPPSPSEPDPTEPSATDPPSPSEPDPTEPTEPDFIEQGESILDELDDVIPDHTDDFSVVLQDFVESMSYEGTDCKFCFPAIIFPAIPGVTGGFQLNEEKEVDFAEFFAMFPDPVFSLVRLLLTAALIIYCVKELYGMIQYVMTMRGGGA